MDADKKHSIGELADLASVSRRTVRYYVQRGLLASPLGAGRGHYYTGGHLQRLLAIKLLQDRGLSLDEIERQLSGMQPGVIESAPPPLRFSFDAHADAAPAPPRAPSPAHARAPERDTTRDRTAAPLPALPDLSLWTRVGIQEGVELHIEGSRYRLSPGRMLRLREAVREIIGEPFPPEPDVHEGLHEGDDDHGQD